MCTTHIEREGQKKRLISKYKIEKFKKLKKGKHNNNGNGYHISSWFMVTVDVCFQICADKIIILIIITIIIITTF